jgi:AcrR family transcriptional regulator
MGKENNTKTAILEKGLKMATHLSLEAITIGGLAKEMKMSKSGLFAHFQSKENLLVEILNYAAKHFTDYVITPALKIERGIPRIRAIVDNWVKWGTMFSGGCIFVDATTEFNDRPGNIQNILFGQQRQWVNVLRRIGESAIKAGDIKPDSDCEQFAYDLYSLVLGHYYYDQLIDDPKIELRKEKALNQFLKTYSS